MIDPTPKPMAKVGSRSSTELPAAALLLSVIALPVYLSHVLHGGLYRDDWRFWLFYHSARPGLGGAIDAFHWTSFRPFQQLWWPATEALLGAHAVPQTTVTVILALAVSVLAYQLLVTLGAGRLIAAAVAVLVLLFPASDATRLWPAADVASAGIVLYLLGAITSLAALRRPGKAALAAHLLAVVLYLASVALYEVALPLIALNALLYRLRSSWRAALLRWAVDLAAVVPFVALVTTNSKSLYPRSSLADVLSHARTFGGDALTLGSRAFVPFGRPAHLLGLVLLVAGLAVAATLIVLSRDRARRLALAAPAVMALAGVVVVAVGYGPYLLSPVFDPLAGGLQNRINVLPSIGFALIVVATIAIVANALPPRLPGVLKPLLVIGLTAAVAVGYAVKVRGDADRWDEAAALQRQTLSAVTDAVDAERRGQPAAKFLRGEYILVFDQYSFTGAGIPVFNEADDLDAAVKARLGDHRETSYPVPLGGLPYCEKHDVWFDTKEVALDDDYGDFEPAGYGHTIFVDVRRHRFTRVDSPHACDQALGGYLPASLLPGG
jgi:hypothetical protein